MRVGLAETAREPLELVTKRASEAVGAAADRQVPDLPCFRGDLRQTLCFELVLAQSQVALPIDVVTGFPSQVFVQDLPIAFDELVLEVGSCLFPRMAELNSRNDHTNCRRERSDRACNGHNIGPGRHFDSSRRTKGGSLSTIFMVSRETVTIRASRSRM